MTGILGEAFGVTPWFWLGALLTPLLALTLARPVARSLGTPWPLGFLLALSAGAILAMTLLPGWYSRLGDALAGQPTGHPTCVVGPVHLLRPWEFRLHSERGLNALLFVPLGAGIALVPRQRRLAAALGPAGLLPFAVEGVQYTLPALGRYCTAVDLADNLTGLAWGLAAGLAARWTVLRWWHRTLTAPVSYHLDRQR